MSSSDKYITRRSFQAILGETEKLENNVRFINDGFDEGTQNECGEYDKKAKNRFLRRSTASSVRMGYDSYEGRRSLDGCIPVEQSCQAFQLLRIFTYLLIQIILLNGYCIKLLLQLLNLFIKTRQVFFSQTLRGVDVSGQLLETKDSISDTLFQDF